MKILHVLNDRNPMGGGVARHVDGLCRLAAVHGVKTTLAYNLVALHQQLETVDAVHIHGARSPLAAIASLLCRLRGKPYVYTPHCYYDHGSLLKKLLKRAWDVTVESFLHRHAATSILLSQAWLDDAHNRGFNTANAAIVPNCILLSEITTRQSIPFAGKLSGTPSLLSISRLDPVKRLEDAIHALAQPGLDEAHLHIVGSGPDKERLQGISRQLGLTERVHFHGWQDDAATTRMLRGADLFLLPSAREGMPTTMLEAFLLGCPVISSDTIGCKAIAEAIGWPYIHHVGDVAALARIVASAPELTAATIDAVSATFSWEARIDSILKIYATAIAPPQNFQSKQL